MGAPHLTTHPCATRTAPRKSEDPVGLKVFRRTPITCPISPRLPQVNRLKQTCNLRQFQSAYAPLPYRHMSHPDGYANLTQLTMASIVRTGFSHARHFSTQDPWTTKSLALGVLAAFHHINFGVVRQRHFSSYLIEHEWHAEVLFSMGECLTRTTGFLAAVAFLQFI